MCRTFKDEFLFNLFSPFASQVISRPVTVTAPAPTVHGRNRYLEKQKGEAFDVSLQGASLTSLSPPCELWASCDLRHCQLGCKRHSCLYALLLVGAQWDIVHLCALLAPSTPKSEQEAHLSYIEDYIDK